MLGVLQIISGGLNVACFHPLEGWRSRVRSESGKLGITFSIRDAYLDLPVTVPCGQCIGCRLERSRQWALRCMSEASLHSENCFITLTYSDENLPSAGSLVKRHFQLFMKKLRKQYSPLKIRFFHCGEYGDLNRRPHYHAIIFGLDFSAVRFNPVVVQERESGNTYYSAALDDLWGRGFATVGAVTFESCAYVARYVMKKVTGNNAERHYEKIIPETGEIVSILPEYITMSLKPGIGKGWFDKFQTDVFPSDEFVSRGVVMKPPKYFERLFAVHNEAELEKIKLKRIKKARVYKAHCTPERLFIRERCKLAEISTLKRSV